MAIEKLVVAWFTLSGHARGLFVKKTCKNQKSRKANLC